MPLWTDIIDPATLTGYVRQDLEDYEASKPSLARYLPNRFIPDVIARFWVGSDDTLVPEARYRSFDAEPELSRTSGGRRVSIELPAISQTIPVSEYNQLRGRNADVDQIRNFILKAATQTARAIADRTERQRGTVLYEGKAVIAQSNYADTTPFDRDPEMEITATAAQKWSGQPDVSRIDFLENALDVYIEKNRENPGRMLMSQKGFRALAAGNEFRTQLLNGKSRPALASDVTAVISSAGLPDIEIFNRRTAGGLILPDDAILFLPEPGPETSEDSPLGGTFYGQTLASTDPAYGLEPVDQPGIVTGTFRSDRIPMLAEATSDAIILPVLVNANLSMVLKGLV